MTVTRRVKERKRRVPEGRHEQRYGTSKKGKGKGKSRSRRVRERATSESDGGEAARAREMFRESYFIN